MFNRDEKINLDDFVSPSDQALLDILICNTDAIANIMKVFADRNSTQVTSAAILGTLVTIIDDLTGVEVPAYELMNIINKYGGAKNDKE